MGKAVAIRVICLSKNPVKMTLIPQDTWEACTLETESFIDLKRLFSYFCFTINLYCTHSVCDLVPHTTVFGAREGQSFSSVQSLSRVRLFATP